MFSTLFLAPFFSLLVVFFFICGMDAGNIQVGGSSSAPDTYRDIYGQSVIQFITNDGGHLSGGCVANYNGHASVFLPLSTWTEMQARRATLVTKGENVPGTLGSFPVEFGNGENRIALLHLDVNLPAIPTGAPKRNPILIAAAWTNGNIASTRFRLVGVRFCQVQSIPERVNYLCAVSDETNGKINVGKGFPLFDFKSGNPVLVGIQTTYFEGGYNLFVLPM